LLDNPGMDICDRAAVADLHRQGHTVRAIASRLGLSRSAVHRALGHPAVQARLLDPEDVGRTWFVDGEPNRLEVYRLRFCDAAEREKRLGVLSGPQRAAVLAAAQEQDAAMAAHWERARAGWCAQNPPRAVPPS
jgi:hypothetical protein